MLVFLPVLASLLSLASAVTQYVHDSSFVPDAVLHVSAKNISAGGIYRYTTIVNGSSPGPHLYLPEGKTTWVRVYNDMTDRNTTMHWHGLAQAASPFSDGTPLASQWPIPPQHFFDYELTPEKGSAGTYFYHAHVGFQASSAAGPLVVLDAKKPAYQYDAVRTFFISELWNRSDASIEAGLENPNLVWSGESFASLVNGQGISNTSVVDPKSAVLNVINVDPSTTYRFRFIGGTSLSLTSMGFESHPDLSVIEADGAYTKPTSTNVLQLGTGQRYSLLFKTKSCAELKALKKTDFYFQIETRERPITNQDYAILRYKDTCGVNAPKYPTNVRPKTAPLTLPPTINGFLDYKLAPLAPNGFPAASEVTRRVVLNLQQLLDGYILWQTSNISWTEDNNDHLPRLTIPRTPYLVDLYENQTQYLPDYNAAVANGGVDPKTQTFPAKIGEVVEVVLQNIGAEALVSFEQGGAGGLDVHPFHAHGKHFYDAGAGPGQWSSSVMEAQLAGTSPVLRDTTLVYRYNATTGANQPSGWRAWRLRIEQPGVWMVHCHTLQHMIMGMQTVWVMGDAKDILTVPKPDVTGYLTYGGNVYGNSTHAPKMVHFSELKNGGKTS